MRSVSLLPFIPLGIRNRELVAVIHFYDTLWLCANFPKWPYCQAYFWCKQILSWFCKPHVMRFYDTWIFSGPDLIIRVDSWNSTIVVTQLLSAFDSVFSFLTTESHTVLQWVVNEIKLYLFLFSSQSAPLLKVLYISTVLNYVNFTILKVYETKEYTYIIICVSFFQILNYPLE